MNTSQHILSFDFKLTIFGSFTIAGQKILLNLNLKLKFIFIFQYYRKSNFLFILTVVSLQEFLIRHNDQKKTVTY